MTSRILAIANQKGGVGKTTVTLSLAAAIANSGRRVLVVDMDPQANASQTLLTDFEDRLKDPDFFTANDILEEGAESSDLGDAIYPTSWTGVDVIASQQQLANRDLEGAIGIDTRLRWMLKGLDTLAEPYDVVLLDCPPSVGRLTVNALVAAPEILLVVEPDLYGENALNQIEATLKQVERAWNHSIRLAGLIINKVGDNNEAKRRVEDLRARYEGVHIALIRRRAALFTEAAGANESIFTSPRRDAAEVADWFTALARDLRLIGAREAVPVAAGHLVDDEGQSLADDHDVDALVAASHPTPTSFGDIQPSTAVGY
jgi:chromosome partitioning protein